MSANGRVTPLTPSLASWKFRDLAGLNIAIAFVAILRRAIA
jgi:hypothetical protein